MAIRYFPLDINIRQSFQASFLGKTITTNRIRFSSNNFNKLAEWELNGQQIKILKFQ